MTKSNERRRSELDDQFSLSRDNRHFSNLNLPADIACYSPKENKCPTTTGLENSHTELLILLLTDNIFRDFFNVFLLLPIHSNQCVVKQSNEGCFFECFPLPRCFGNRLSVVHMLEWLYANRLPFFLTSRIYQLCLFTNAFCSKNVYMDFDEEIEYSKKELVIFAEMRTVEGIQKLIRHAGSSADGFMIQLWLDLQLLRHTDKDHGHLDMMKSIRDRYSSPSNKLPNYFKNKLVAAIDEIGKISLNSCLLTRRENFMSSYEILLHNPFVQKHTEENINNLEGTINIEKAESPLSHIQCDIMNNLKNDFCRRYLSYYECLPAKFLVNNKHQKEAVEIDDRFSINLNTANTTETCFLESGRSKSTLPQLKTDMLHQNEVKQRPKTCYPHLHPKLRNLSRLSAKTSGYMSLTTEDRLAFVSSVATDCSSQYIRKVSSLPNLWNIQLSCEVLQKSYSTVSLIDNSSINVNESAIRKCRRSIANYKEGTDSQISNHSMSIDVSLSQTSNVDTSTAGSPDPQPAKISVSQSCSVPKAQKNIQKVALPLIIKGRNNSVHPIQEKRSSGADRAFSPTKQPASIILNKELSTSVRRNTTFKNVMDSRRASSFIGKLSGSQKNSSFNLHNNSEKQKMSDEIIQNKTNDSMLSQDKHRFYVAIIASDQLAGGPFRNYLDCTHNETMTDYLSLWENIEVVRCLTNEGGRRGAIAKSFGGNGFLSCHDDWPVTKDDPYHKYQENLRQIRKYPDPWHDFMKKVALVRDFFACNKIIKPYDLGEINTFVEQLSSSKCDDEILALVQEYMITKLKKQIDQYFKFDTENFSYYLSHHDKNFSFKIDKNYTKSEKFLNRCHSKRQKRRSNIDLLRSAFFSPLSCRLWVAIDMCERMIFPFAVRKLSMPMVTLGTMIQMKMYIMRKRKQIKGKKKAVALDIPETDVKKVSVKKEPIFKKIKRKKKEISEYTVLYFAINWDKLLNDLRTNSLDNINILKMQVTKDFDSLAPPTIEDMMLQDTSLKFFRRFINLNYKHSEKEHLINVLNFLFALKDLDKKLDAKDFFEWSKGICSTFLFGKQTILLDMYLHEEKLRQISKKRVGNPTFLLNISCLVKEWIYSNVWINFISKMYSNSLIDYEQYFKSQKIAKWKPTVLKKPFCKRMLQLVITIGNLLVFLSKPEQFEHFREFLVKQKSSSNIEKVLIGKKNNVPIWVSKLPQDLYLLMDIISYKNFVLSIRKSAEDLSLDSHEEMRIFKKAELIQETFFDSPIPPRLQVNLPTIVATDISISLKNQHLPYSLFNEATCYLLLTLLSYWRKFCISEFAPESNIKFKVLEKLSGVPLTYRSNFDDCNWTKNTQGLIFTNSVSSKFSMSKGVEIAGLNFTVSNGFKEIYRPINTFNRPSNSNCKMSKSKQSFIGNKTSKQSFRGQKVSTTDSTEKPVLAVKIIDSKIVRSSIAAEIRRK